ncbi:alpha-2,8-sialyltransferase 8F-like isoform 2-T2 [Pholidichthys leucotaenia]
MRGAMRGQLFSMIIMLLCMGSLVTTIFWFLVDKNYADYNPPRPQKKEKPGVLCKGCKKVIDDVNQHFSEPWQKQEENYKKLRSLLNSNCSGFDTAIITQTNTPLGTKIKYDGEDTYLTVTPTIFKTFLKEHPFLNKTWNTCAVVGNGGILAESYCGKMIDSAELVMRCNLPPVTGEYERHVGSKTDFVTANPTIVKKNSGSFFSPRGVHSPHCPVLDPPVAFPPPVHCSPLPQLPSLGVEFPHQAPTTSECVGIMQNSIPLPPPCHHHHHNTRHQKFLSL